MYLIYLAKHKKKWSSSKACGLLLPDPQPLQHGWRVMILMLCMLPLLRLLLINLFLVFIWRNRNEASNICEYYFIYFLHFMFAIFMKAKLITSLLFLLIVLCIFSCTPQRRLSRLIRKNPELITRDTIVILDTTFIKGSSIESSFNFEGDTIYIHDSIQTIKYFYNTKTQTHYIKGEVQDREVIREVKIPYDKIVVANLTWWQEYKGWLFLFLIFGVLLHIYKKM